MSYFILKEETWIIQLSDPQLVKAMHAYQYLLFLLDMI